MAKVIVKDELMGSGKSTRMIEQINESPIETRWIIVAPFLSECHRYAGTTADEETGKLQSPLRDEQGMVIYDHTKGCAISGRHFYHPEKRGTSKVEHISRLVQEGKDIVTTHEALKLFTPDTIANIKDAGYNLVIDESLEVIKQHPLRLARRKMLLESKAVYTDDNQVLRWNPEYSMEDKYDHEDESGWSWEQRVKALCDNGSLILVEDETGKNRDIFMWEYPSDFLKAFDTVYVMTYMFEGSVLQKYLKYHSLPYTIEYGILRPLDTSLITIIDNPNLNRIGERVNAFSVSDQKKKVGQKDSVHVKTTINNLENYFKNKTYMKSKGNQRLWTCLQEAKTTYSGRGYSKRHLPFNTKAINDYRDTCHLAYIFNVYMQPEPYKYLANRGEEYAPSEEVFALSEMLQWIYRSRVRDNLPVTIYVPSIRMRELLVDWLYSTPS